MSSLMTQNSKLDVFINNTQDKPTGDINLRNVKPTNRGKLWDQMREKRREIFLNKIWDKDRWMDVYLVSLALLWFLVSGSSKVIKRINFFRSVVFCLRKPPGFSYLFSDLANKFFQALLIFSYYHDLTKIRR